MKYSLSKSITIITASFTLTLSAQRTQKLQSDSLSLYLYQEFLVIQPKTPDNLYIQAH